MVKNIKFTNHWDNFQKKIINDAKKIHNSNKIFIFADSTHPHTLTHLQSHVKIPTKSQRFGGFFLLYFFDFRFISFC